MSLVLFIIIYNLYKNDYCFSILTVDEAAVEIQNIPNETELSSGHIDNNDEASPPFNITYFVIPEPSNKG